MTQQRLIQAIGRIERALSRLERAPARPENGVDDNDLLARHEKLKSETRAAIADIDQILAGSN
jgi:hypothetical protein